MGWQERCCRNIAIIDQIIHTGDSDGLGCSPIASGEDQRGGGDIAFIGIATAEADADIHRWLAGQYNGEGSFPTCFGGDKTGSGSDGDIGSVGVIIIGD